MVEGKGPSGTAMAGPGPHSCNNGQCARSLAIPSMPGSGGLAGGLPLPPRQCQAAVGIFKRLPCPPLSAFLPVSHGRNTLHFDQA